MCDVRGRVLVHPVDAHELLVRRIPVMHVGKQSFGVEEAEGQYEDESDGATEQRRVRSRLQVIHSISY